MILGTLNFPGKGTMLSFSPQAASAVLGHCWEDSRPDTLELKADAWAGM